MDVSAIHVDSRVPNPWNPNRMDDRTWAKIRANLQREGFVKPLVVRNHPERPEAFQIIDGEHRWKIACELKLATVPCMVIDVDDARAKVLTVNLNELGGDPAPEALAQLVHDLSNSITLADLESQLPFSTRELEDHLALLKLPAGLLLELDEAADEHEAQAPKVLTFVVDETEAIEAALTGIAGDLEGKNRRGRALVMLAQAWVAANPTAPVAEASP